MNPADNNPQSNMELPSVERPPGQVTQAPPQEMPMVPVERASGAMEQPGSAQPSPPPATAAPLPILDPGIHSQGVAGQPMAAPAASSQSPAVADDADLIEKEWVLKAKAIVAQTREDPHVQNREMSKFKADYVKKRYNREIKVAQD